MCVGIELAPKYDIFSARSWSHHSQLEKSSGLPHSDPDGSFWHLAGATDANIRAFLINGEKSAFVRTGPFAHQLCWVAQLLYSRAASNIVPRSTPTTAGNPENVAPGPAARLFSGITRTRYLMASGPV